MRQRFTWFALGWLLLLSVSAVLAAPATQPTTAPASDPPAPKADPRESIAQQLYSSRAPVAPPEFISQLIQAIPQSPRYRQASFFLYDTVRKAADQWQEEIHLGIDVKSSEIGQSLYGDEFALPDGKKVHFENHIDFSKPFIKVLSEQGYVLYVIPTDQLAILKKSVAIEMTILDPVNRNQPGVSVGYRALSLTDALSQLAQKGDLQWAYRSDQFNEIRVTCYLRDKSVGDILEFLGRATDFQMIYDPQLPRDKPLLRPQNVQFLVDINGLIPILPGRISPSLDLIRFEDLGPDPIEDLHQLVVRAAELLKTQRPVLVIQPVNTSPAAAPTP